MGWCARLAAAVIGPAVAAVLVLPSAWAAPATGVDDVVEALGLTSEPADYVVLVDTSGSMNANGRYATVRRELARLVDGLDSDDRVSLLTFDSAVKPRFRGIVGDNTGDVLAGLPASAGGVHTDIGAAIDAGLTELERADTHRLAALILITDGKLDAPGSAYEVVKSEAWKALRTRASALARDHQVAAYAVSLQATTDARLLARVFPRATEVAAAQVGDRFARLGADLARLQAAEALKEEVRQAIPVTWTADLGAALAAGAPADVELVFTSPYAHVPVELRDIRPVAPPGLQVELSGLPEKVVLDPGAKVAVKGRARVAGTAQGEPRVTLTATVDSPWRKPLEDDLGLTFAPVLDGSAPVPAPPVSLPPTLLPLAGTAAGLAGAAVVVLLLVRILFTPTMGGVISFRRGDRELGEIVVNGRRMKLVPPVAATELTGLAGTAAGARGPKGVESAVRVTLRFGTTKARGLIPDAGTITLGDLEVGYTSGRRRILDKIGLPRPQSV
jgi:hypothetical protein